MRFGNKNEGERLDGPTKARMIVAGYQMLDLDDVYVVWFCYILGGWKALVSTTIPDDRYYEVTHKPDHDGSDGPAVTYLDAYTKTSNITIPG